MRIPIIRAKLAKSREKITCVSFLTVSYFCEIVRPITFSQARISLALQNDVVTPIHNVQTRKFIVNIGNAMYCVFYLGRRGGFWGY